MKSLLTQAKIYYQCAKISKTPSELQKKIVIVIPSYNNARWYKKNLDSVFAQEYDNYQVIYIDDNSSDGTGTLVQNYIKACGKENNVTLILNTQRMGAMYNHYHAVHACPDDAIVINLDGDDWLAHKRVLQKLNQIYTQNDIWMTYGQFVEYPSGNTGFCKDFPMPIVQNNDFRNHAWLSSHLRTFYAWLFKKIHKEDFMYKGEFLQMTCDWAIMFPMLEMAGKHQMCVPEILCVYNTINPLRDQNINISLQQSLAQHIRTMPRYKPLEQK